MKTDDDWGVLPEDDPKITLHDSVLPIWCRVSHEWLLERGGEDFGWGFSSGFLAGLIMAVLEREWAARFHAAVRRYYLTNGLTNEDLPWPRYAKETVRALPIQVASELRNVGEARLHFRDPLGHEDDDERSSGMDE